MGQPLGLPTQVYIKFAVVLLAMLLMRRTIFGRYVLAIGGNEEAARLMGLTVIRTKMLVYAISGAMAGFAGVLLAARSGTSLPTEGVGWELQAISAVVVGGTLLTGDPRAVLVRGGAAAEPVGKKKILIIRLWSYAPQTY